MKIKPKAANAAPLIPPGTHQGVVCQLLDFGSHLVKNQKSGKEELKRKLRIIWELPFETSTFDGVERRRTIGRTFNVGYHEKGHLLPFVVALLGRQMTAKELAGEFDTDCLLGRNCLIDVIHLTGDKGPYSFVAKAVQLARGMTPVSPAGETRVFNLPADDGPIELPEWMPDYFKDKVKLSDEWKAKYGTPESAGIGSEEE